MSLPPALPLVPAAPPADASGAALAAPAAPPLLLALFGTPSAMTHWGIHVARIAVGATRGEHSVLSGSYRADFVGIEAAHRTVLCTSDCPEVALSRLMVEAAAAVVVFAEDPGDVIDDLVAVSGVDHVNALRLSARSLCALQPAIGAPGATVFGRAHLDGAMSAFVDALLAALRIAPTPAERVEIDRHLAAPAGSARDDLARLFPAFAARRSELALLPVASLEHAGDAPDGAPTAVLPAPEVAAIKAVADGYAGLAAGLPLATVTWPPAIFSSGDSIGAFVAGPSEMIGRARIIIYGPYMHLPAGEWTAAVEMEVADNLSGNRLKVDLVSGPSLLVSAGVDMPALGRYAFALDFAIVEPLEPVELRFQIESGAIEGRFLLRRVVMTRRPSAAATP